MLAVMAFMLFYYRGAGINADLALILNLIILLGLGDAPQIMIGFMLSPLSWWNDAFVNIPLAIGFGWLEASFHTIIPNTIKAKRIGYSVPYRPLAHAILSSDHDLGLCALFLSAVIVGIIFFKTRAGAHEFCRKNATGIFLLGYALAAWCVYLAGDTMIFRWYRPIVVLPLVLGTILCLIVDGSLLNALPASILTALLCVPAYGYVAAAVLSKPDSIPGYVDAARVHTYLRVGDAIWKACPNSRKNMLL